MATSWVWGTVTATAPLAVQLDGDSAPLAITPDSLVPLSSLNVGARVRCELSERRLVVHGAAAPNSVMMRGSTAARDAFYGTPSTTPQQVALANQLVQWFNTDLGWFESYYAVTGSSGLTVTGLLATAAAGWYPVGGLLPEITLEPTATFNATSGNNVGNWSGTVRRTGGSAWFTYDQYGIVFAQAGRYDLTGWTTMVTGSGTANFHLRINDSGGNLVTHQDGGAWDLNGSLWRNALMGMKSEPVFPTQKLVFLDQAGTLTVHAGPASTQVSGQLQARYVSPPLVSV